MSGAQLALFSAIRERRSTRALQCKSRAALNSRSWKNERRSRVPLFKADFLAAHSLAKIHAQKNKEQMWGKKTFLLQIFAILFNIKGNRSFSLLIF